MTHIRRDWDHPTGVGGTHEDGVARHDELIVDEDDWSRVRRVLEHESIGFAPNPPVAYGLVRVTLSDDYDAVAQQHVLDAIDAAFAAEKRHARFGRNRLMARARIEFDDDDVQSTPKPMPSSVAPAVPAAPPAGSRTYRGARAGQAISVGVVDTPFTRHSALDGRCVYRPVPPSDLVHQDVIGEVTGHATFIAGIALRLAPDALIRVENVVEADGLADLVSVHDAICRLGENGVDVVNLSLGCVTADDEEPFVLAHAFEWVRENADRVPVYVASAGNEGSTRRFWPAARADVWAVAGASVAGGVWSLASYSGRGAWVDVAAPSDSLYSTRPDLGPGVADYNSWATWSGTSFATAVLTGLIAASLAAGEPPVVPPGTLTLPGQRRTVADGTRTLPLFGADAGLQAPP